MGQGQTPRRYTNSLGYRSSAFRLRNFHISCQHVSQLADFVRSFDDHTAHNLYGPQLAWSAPAFTESSDAKERGRAASRHTISLAGCTGFGKSLILD